MKEPQSNLKVRIASWFRCLAAIALCAAVPLPVAAQQATPAVADDNEGLDIQGLFEKAGALMEDSRWEDALKPLGVIIKDYGPSGFQDFGPAFGVMWYRYGFCLKNVKRFDEALEA
ncbi:MAG: hypothetical protein KDK97_24035, partial [Verrucomicrobiales bacterium]|nr:hypothetical protein [Verrucomicrobiales bacterium]